jgi:hypothetical protein
MNLNKELAINSGFSDNGRKLMRDNMMVVQEVTIAGAAHGTNGLAFTLDNSMRLIHMFVRCTAASSDGTLQLRVGTTAISNAVVCAVDKTITAASTLDPAQTTLTAGTSYNIKANATGDAGVVTLIGVLV